MKKLPVVISNCYECPYFREGKDIIGLFTKERNKDLCGLIDKEFIAIPNCTPDFCPLEDVEDEQI